MKMKTPVAAPAVVAPAGQPSYADLLAKVQALEAKAERKGRMDTGAVTDNGLKLAVSAKGAVSVYGLGRFPVTLYREQMGRLLADAKDITAFIAANADKLATKTKTETVQ
jgi:hypothetical protein